MTDCPGKMMPTNLEIMEQLITTIMIKMTDAFSFFRVATNIPPYTMELVWVEVITFPLFPEISSSEKTEGTWCKKSNKLGYPISTHLTLDSTHVPMVIS